MGRSEILAFVVAVALVAAAREAAGQSTTTPSCAQKLTPCANYINSTNPPSTCCDSLRDAIDNELPCLCNLLTTPGLLASLGINVTEAVELPRHCNIIGADLSACGKASSPTSSSEPPPATPGSDKNGVGRFAGTGISSMFLFLASLVLLC